MKLDDFDQGGNKVLPAGDYTLKIVDVEVKEGTESGVPFAILDVVSMVGETKGKHTELTFSFSEKGRKFAKCWLVAVGLDGGTEVPIDDSGDLGPFLKKNMVGCMVTCTLSQEKDKAGYDKNSVSPPWEVFEYTGEEIEDVDGEEVPDWAK